MNTGHKTMPESPATGYVHAIPTIWQWLVLDHFERNKHGDGSRDDDLACWTVHRKKTSFLSSPFSHDWLNARLRRTK